MTLIKTLTQPCWMPQDEFAMRTYEEHVRYHLICDHELCENEATAADPEGFHPGLNMEQLNKVRR